MEEGKDQEHKCQVTGDEGNGDRSSERKNLKSWQVDNGLVFEEEMGRERSVKVWVFAHSIFAIQAWNN